MSKWVDKGGTVWQEIDGKTWVYQDWESNTVRYLDGYPDFTPYERQSVDVPDLQGNHARTSTGDFGEADALAEKGKADYTKNTWHHHQNGTTMQEVPSRIHRKFTHRGGGSFIKRSFSKD